jgi:TRAP-type C4-dicarboxylate transport system permease small subunit
MKRAYDAFCRIEALIAGSFLVLMVLLIFGGGIARMLRTPQNWTTEAATCLFAWACFLCADIAWRRNSLMAIEVVTDKLAPNLQQYLRLLNYALIAAFLAYLIWMGFKLTWTSRFRTFQGIPGVSYSWVTASLPFGAVLLLLTTIGKVRAQLRGEHEANRAVDVI